MDAVNTLLQIERENRAATPDEQEVLAKYVGWGGLADAFDESKPNWSNEYQELVATLSPEEYAAARSSTLNAHYTSPTVIKAIYEAVDNMHGAPNGYFLFQPHNAGIDKNQRQVNAQKQWAGTLQDCIQFDGERRGKAVKHKADSAV